MARKTASKPADEKAVDKAQAVDKTVEAASQAQADAENAETKGGDATNNGVGAPGDAPSTQPEGHKGGEDRSDLPVTIAADEGQQLPDGAAWMVVCHRTEGRRRAGRHWAAGETPVIAGELTDYDLALLRGDPQFTVFEIEAD